MLGDRSNKFYFGTLIGAFISYAGIIVFAFIPTTSRIEESGYTTADLQTAKTKAEVDTILKAWVDVIDTVYLQTFFDYLFIIAGFLLFYAIHSLIYKQLSDHNLRYLPLMNMVLTVLSRSLDAFENLWGLLIYSNPSNYWTGFIPLLNTTEALKWAVVGIEYTSTGLSILIFLIWKLLKKSPTVTQE